MTSGGANYCPPAQLPTERERRKAWEQLLKADPEFLAKSEALEARRRQLFGERIPSDAEILSDPEAAKLVRWLAAAFLGDQ